MIPVADRYIDHVTGLKRNISVHIAFLKKRFEIDLDRFFLKGFSKDKAAVSRFGLDAPAPGENIHQALLCLELIKARLCDRSQNGHPLASKFDNSNHHLRIVQVFFLELAGDLLLNLADGLACDADTPEQGQSDRPVGFHLDG